MEPIYANWVVLEAKPTEDFKILLSFADGTQRIFDFTSQLKKPIYSHLNDPTLFLKGHAQFDSVVWDDETDIAPEYLYEHSSILETSKA